MLCTAMQTAQPGINVQCVRFELTAIFDSLWFTAAKHGEHGASLLVIQLDLWPPSNFHGSQLEQTSQDCVSTALSNDRSDGVADLAWLGLIISCSSLLCQALLRMAMTRQSV